MITDDGELTASDRNLLARIDREYRDPGGHIQERRLELFAELGRALKADYVCWGAGQHNVAQGGYATLEFVDVLIHQHDHEDETRQLDEEEQRLKWLRLGMELNNHPATAWPAYHLTEQREIITTRRIDWVAMERKGALREKIARAVRTLQAAPLITKWSLAGLREFMFTTVRLNAPTERLRITSSAGFHRKVGGAAFSQRECLIAHHVSTRHPWLYAIGVNGEVDATGIPLKYLVILPFILRGDTAEQIGRLIGRPTRTVEKQIIAIAIHLGLPEENKNAIIKAFHPRWKPRIESRDARKDLAEALNSLK